MQKLIERPTPEIKFSTDTGKKAVKTIAHIRRYVDMGLHEVEIAKLADMTVPDLRDLMKDKNIRLMDTAKLFLNDKATVINHIAALLAGQMTEEKMVDAELKDIAKAFDIMNKNHRLETNQSTSIKETIASTLITLISQTDESPRQIAEPVEEAELL